MYDKMRVCCKGFYDTFTNVGMYKNYTVYFCSNKSMKEGGFYGNDNFILEDKNGSLSFEQGKLAKEITSYFYDKKNKKKR